MRSTPVDVSGLSGAGVTAIAAAGRWAPQQLPGTPGYTCVVTTSGGVKCWGYNHYGQLGDGTTTHRYTPADVTGLH